MTKIWEIQVFIAKKYDSPDFIGGLIEKDRALVYMPSIGQKVKERL